MHKKEKTIDTSMIESVCVEQFGGQLLNWMAISLFLLKLFLLPSAA